jgi:predicted dehydrogenase
MTPIRIGIVGCGDVLRAYQTPLETLRGRGLVEIVAACARNAEKRRPVLEELRVPRFVTDYRELVRSVEVDLVLVLTSMREHGPIARAALEAGKHVLVEKPMAVTLDEAVGLVELARQSPGHLVCAPFVQLSPTYQTIAHRIQRGDIGPVFSARARYGWSGPWWSPWFYQQGGGALFDLGVYSITTLTGLLGPARRVMAMTGVAIPEREVEGEPVKVEAEDNVQLLLDFGDARFAVVTTGFTLQQYRCPALELYGSAGTLQMLGDDWAPDGYELWQNKVGAWQLYPETDRAWHWTDGIGHLVDCLHRNRRPLVAPEHAFHVLEIMIRAQESGRDGQARSLTSTFTPPTFAETPAAEPRHRVHDPTRRSEPGPGSP